tara:strand:- start:584 stop:2794 length:2211 start_codon:yes stop_codon:yes gene_type:complete
MAIKFSQFVVQTDASTLSHVVGYNGVDNIQITPTNFLNSLLTGTAGQVLFYDTTGVTGDNAFYWNNTNKRLGIGITTPERKLHLHQGDSTLNYIQITNDTTGQGGGDGVSFGITSDEVAIWNNRENTDASISTNNTERIRITSTGNVGIGTNTPTSKLEVDGDMSVTPGGVILLPDSSFLRFGTSSDATIYHDATDTYFKNFTGDLIIQNNKDDKDIIFQSDNGSGGLDTYFRIDGSAHENSFFKQIHLHDNVKAVFGASADLKIYHDSSDSYLENSTSDLIISNTADDGDIIFKSDDGSGGIATYFQIDGSAEQTRFYKDTRHTDNIKANFGNGDDLQIYHDATDTWLDNFTGNLNIRNQQNSGDIIFRSDNGNGGIAEYFRVDGGDTNMVASKTILYLDTVKASFGNSEDLKILHNGTFSSIQNNTGDFKIINYADDKDIVFESDNGAGGTAEYFKLDGSTASGGSLYTQFPDNSNLTFGAGNDLRIYHNGTNSNIENFNGTLQFVQNLNDGDIKFLCDDGSGGVSAYITLDGSNVRTRIDREMRFMDTIPAKFGTGGDLEIYHNASDSVIENNVGDLYITNKQDDGNIIFRSDNGSGGVATYFYLDGGNTFTNFQLNARWVDNAKAQFGNSGDLQIYHDGSNSFIDDTGTGILYIRAAANMYFQTYGSGKRWASFFENQGIELFYNDVKKLETRSTGIKISGVSEYANNTAALAAGLVVGDVYRTGDDLKIVH